MNRALHYAARMVFVPIIWIAVVGASANSITIRYDAIVDASPYTHAQLPVGDLIKRITWVNFFGSSEDLSGIEDLLDPFLEPCAFVLNDSLVEFDSGFDRAGLIDLGALYPVGAAQPAWADLVRSRRYFVLSDGQGFARIFARTEDPVDSEEAWKRNYSVLRLIVNSLLDPSAPAKWTIEVFGYTNAIRAQKLTLQTEPFRVTVAAPLGPPAGLKPLDLDAIARLFDAGIEPEGIVLPESGSPFLFGSTPEKRPTLAGDPVTLADLAVAYRAVAHSRGELFMSLDAGPDIRFAEVQFSGRLHDTRIGLVTLLADCRFKSIGNGIDAITRRNRHAEIMRSIPGFVLQAQRMMRDDTEEETVNVRHWYYPDQVESESATDGQSTVFRIARARFVAGAEKTDGTRSQKAVDQPAYVRDTIAEFNQNIDRFGEIFPEVRELESVARLLALATHIRDNQPGVDWDALLATRLPQCRTPRQIQQSVTAFFGPNADVPRSTIIDVTDQTFDQVEEDANAADSVTQSDRALHLGAVLALREYLGAMILGVELGEPGPITYGGLDLDMSAAIRRAGTMPNNRGTSLVELAKRQPLTDHAVPGLSKPVRGSPVASGADGGGKQPPGPPHAVTDDAPGPSQRRGAGPYHEIRVDGVGDSAGLQRTVALAGSDAAPAKTRYVSEAGNEFSLYERGVTTRYKIEKSSGGVLIAQKLDRSARPVEADVKSAAKQLVEDGSPMKAWDAIPEKSAVLDIERLGNDRFAIVARETAGSDRLAVWRIEKGGALKRESGPDALGTLAADVRKRLASLSDSKKAFLSTSLAGDAIEFQLGKKSAKINPLEFSMLGEGPIEETSPRLAELISAPDVPKTIIIYRGIGTRRPKRHGDESTFNAEIDPVRLASDIQAAFPGKQIRLDDDPEAAIRRIDQRVVVKGPKDVFLVHPAATDWGVLTYGTKDAILKGWKNLGLSAGTDLPTTSAANNIVVLTAHNNNELFDILNRIGPKLEGKFVMLITCGEPSNANRISEFLLAHRAAGCLIFPEPIEATAVQQSLLRFGQLVQQKPATVGSEDAMSLWRRAVDQEINALDSDEMLKHDSAFRRQFEKLKRAVIQISMISEGKVRRVA